MTTNLVNGKRYIGKTYKDSAKSKYYLGGGLLLQAAVKKYGKTNFKKDIIVEGSFNRNFLDALEKHYIQLYAAQVRKDFYNIASGGEGGKPLSNYYPATTIYRFDSNGIFIEEYNTTFAELGRKIGLTTSNVTTACKSQRYCVSINGYLALTPHLVNLRESRYKGIGVDVYTKEGEFVGEFRSIPEAAKCLNYSEKGLRTAYEIQGLTGDCYYVLEKGSTKPITFIECIDTNIDESYYFMSFIEALKFLSETFSLKSYRYKELHVALNSGNPYKGLLFRYITTLLCH